MEMFDAKYIDTELGNIGSRIKTPLKIYLIGGCAMSFRGLKESTKDVDIVFKSRADYEVFCSALFGAQYFEPLTIVAEYAHLEAIKMFENKDLFHLDLFVERVCSKMKLSSGVVARSEFYRSYGGMEVYLVAKEDIFLFKSLASEGRKRDLDDMRILYPNLDWKAMDQELKRQRFDPVLNSHIAARLEEFRAKHDLDVPLLSALKRKGK
jgi:hypothetical protein